MAGVARSDLHIFGMDINPAVERFRDPTTTITIGDQTDSVMCWQFFAHTTGGQVDILIDDGGHTPRQMLVTLITAFDQVAKGGLHIIEDIHGPPYLDSMWVPAAGFLGSRAASGQLASVHLFPYLLIAKKTGDSNAASSTFAFEGSSEVVRDFASLWLAIPKHYGGHVVLENSDWGSFLSEQALAKLFRVFLDLHHYDIHLDPPGCRREAQRCSLCLRVRVGGLQ